MKTKNLEVKVNGESLGKIEIARDKTVLEIKSNILPSGTYMFTMREIEALITRKMQRDYPGKEVELVYN